jgi:hypothetical protein
MYRLTIAHCRLSALSRPAPDSRKRRSGREISGQCLADCSRFTVLLPRISCWDAVAGGDAYEQMHDKSTSTSTAESRALPLDRLVRYTPVQDIPFHLPKSRPQEFPALARVPSTRILHDSLGENIRLLLSLRFHLLLTRACV